MNHPDAGRKGTEALSRYADLLVREQREVQRSLDRQIALLEAHILESKIEKLEAEFSHHVRTYGIDRGSYAIQSELQERYVAYALKVIVAKALSHKETVHLLNRISEKLKAFFSYHYDAFGARALAHLSRAHALFHNTFSAWMRHERVQVLKRIQFSEVASLRVPLFAYGPELSEDRHRFR